MPTIFRRYRHIQGFQVSCAPEGIKIRKFDHHHLFTHVFKLADFFLHFQLHCGPLCKKTSPSGGGIVFYVYDSGRHGLIAATTDQSASIRWYNGTSRLTGTTGDGVGAGAMNTAMIVATQISDTPAGNFAAKVCADYSVTVGGVTYGDWYLPSKFELNLMYQNIGPGAAAPLTNAGGFTAALYWSSSELDSSLPAWNQYFGNGTQNYNYKYYTNYVRAVRAF